MAPAAEAVAEVAFRVRAETSFGDAVHVVGATPTLGAWKPQAGVALSTDAANYPQWSATVPISSDDCTASCVEFKFVIIRRDGSIFWEEGPNRRLLAQKACSSESNVAPHQALLFGQPSAVALSAQPVLPCGNPKVAPAGVPRLDSFTSTACALEGEDDTQSTTLTSRCASSVCLLPLESSGSSEEEHPAEQPAPSPLLLHAGAFRAPKPGGRCEDAFFFGAHAAGVADGVGQMADYAKHGIDAAVYAAELMELAASMLARGEAEGAPEIRAQSAISEAEATTQSFGASTITVMALGVAGATAGVANLGDSGFMQLRAKTWGMEVIERSREQNHGWNCPYQLTHVPEELAVACGATFDHASDCQRYQLSLQAGDLLLLFTDGLTDNLEWFEIVRLVEESLGPDKGSPESRAQPDALAKALVLAAQERSMDTEAMTPFSRTARRHRLHAPGGKIDDITVVASWVVPGSAQPVPEVVTLGCHDSAESTRGLQF